MLFKDANLMSKELHSVEVCQVQAKPTFLCGLKEKVLSKGIFLPK